MAEDQARRGEGTPESSDETTSSAAGTPAAPPAPSGTSDVSGANLLTAEGETVILRQSAAQSISGERVRLERSGAKVIDGKTVELERSGAGRIQAEQVTLNGGSASLVQARELHMTQGNALLVRADRAELHDSRVALLIGKAEGNPQIALTLPGAAALGAALGAVLVLARWIIGRR